ncbi:YceI family protein [Zavarzinia sp. CC-PAN008]|uniref:YceI family protein n=1 Tax=Zavarzinia sp. CC-PAN008 TaxID=3243332 RepID=UPI003F7464B6
MIRRSVLGLAAAALLAIPAAQAAPWKLDESHTQVLFSVNHLGFSTVHGWFGKGQGTLDLNPEKPAESKVTFTIDAASVQSGWAARDEHLKNKDFFNVEQFPTITFTSTSVEVTGEKTAKVTGDLTLLGVTKPVVLDVTLNNMGPHPMNQKQVAGFTATTTIKRSEFGMSYGVPVVGDEIPLIINTEATPE